MIQTVITPDLDQLRASMDSAKAAEARFWVRMTELGIPAAKRGTPSALLSPRFRDGASHSNPWAVAADLLADQ